jgi:predicted DNA-binding transcriptional regulator YafY
VSRTLRLLELLIKVQSRPSFTAQELAEEFGVSRRTMLRDLGALYRRWGVLLRSTPGPGGGYRCRGEGASDIHTFGLVSGSVRSRAVTRCYITHSTKIR